MTTPLVPSETWVAPRLTDGLGNRLFQLAAAFQAAKRWSRPLVFAMSSCRPASHGRWDSIIYLFPSVPQLWNPAPSVTLNQGGVTAFDYKPIPDQAPADRVLLKGSWIAAKYVEEDFKPNWDSAVPQEVKATLLANFGLETEDLQRQAVFLHVRLGDYLKLPHHQVPLLSYFAKAMALFPPDTHFLIFSDEIEKVKQMPLFACEERCAFVDEKDEVRTLFLMSSCWRGGITANSTFSWWGAFFGRQRAGPEHTTFMPSRWMASDENTADVYPPWAILI